MSVDFLAGTWVYRSFRNLPQILPEIDPDHPVRDDLTKWSQYLFGQGEMEFHPGLNGNLDGSFAMGPNLEMDLSGSIVRENDRVTVSWHAVGRPDQESEGWIYEYRGELMPSWPDGVRQTDAIVGTVIRVVAHDDLAPAASTDRIAPAGSVVSFLMVRKRFKEAREAIPLPGNLLQELGSKQTRLLNLVWHLTRNQWTTLSLEQQKAIEKLGWQPPRARQQPVRGTVASRERDNGAGEDFLYMHRMLLEKMKTLLSMNGQPPIAAWQSIPQPSRSSDNADGFAVPPSWSRASPAELKSLELIKSDDYMTTRMAFLERRFKDPAYLSKLTLDQLGAKLEMQIRNQMLTRWASLPLDPETMRPLPEGRDRYDVSAKWMEAFSGPDGKAAYYDDIADEFSAPVHPLFWRLHGWIDDRIEDWAKAHGADVKAKQVGGIEWFDVGRWVRVDTPWVAGTNLHAMEQVLQILSGRQTPRTHPETGGKPML